MDPSLHLAAAAIHFRWAAEEILGARSELDAAGIGAQADWLLVLATHLADMSHDIFPTPNTSEDR